MPIADFLPLMPETVSVASYTGSDGYGQPQHGSPVDYRARVIYRAKLVRAANGEETVARGEVWLATTTAIDEQDQITLPDGTTPPILMVEQLSDADGPHHTKVAFG